MMTGDVDKVIRRFKYNPDPRARGWAPILGRLVLGWLDENCVPTDYDLILPNPTSSTRLVRHTELIMEAAWKEDMNWVWPLCDPSAPALQKSVDTSRSAGKTWQGKRQAANELEQALEVVDPGLIQDRRILVVDDVATTLLSQNAVARVLRSSGAAHVDGLVLARHPWQ